MTQLVLYFLLAVLLSFICSLLEAVLLSLSHAQVALLVEKQRNSGLILAGFKNKIDRPLSAILTVNTVANTVGAAGVGAQALAVFGSKWVALVSAGLTLSILVFSEIVPKTIGTIYCRQLAPLAAYMIKGLIWCTYPFVVTFEVLGRLFSRGAPLIKITREEVGVAAEMGKEGGVLADREKSIIQNLLHLHKIQVKSILTPRSVLFALPQNETVAGVLEKHKQIQFSRIPVYGRDLDDIYGLVGRYQINSAFSHGRPLATLGELARPIKVVPATKSVADVLDEFIQSREHIFLVVDEYGGTAGIITLEDAIETLLGVEIVDELDKVDDMQAFALEQWEKRKKAKNYMD